MTKSLLIGALLFSSALSMADVLLGEPVKIATARESAILPEGSYSLTPAEAPTIVSVVTKYPKCRPGAQCMPMSVATLQFLHNGCLNSLSPVSYEVSSSGNKTVITVSAFVIDHKDSPAVMCYMMPRSNLEVVVGRAGMSADDVEVRVLGQ